MSVDSRSKMEIEANKEAVLFITRKKFKSEVPQADYDICKEKL